MGEIFYLLGFAIAKRHDACLEQVNQTYWLPNGGA